MIISVEEAKRFLQITDNSKDELIKMLIPIVQDFVVKYTRNFFEILTDSIYRESNEISFSNGKITDAYEKLIESGFIPNIHVRVSGSVLNDGIYEVTDVEASALTLSADIPLTDEPSGAAVKLTAVKFPKGIKLPVAQLIGYNLEKQRHRGLASERLADWLANYESDYPKALLSGLNQFRKINNGQKPASGYYDIYTKRNL